MSFFSRGPDCFQSKNVVVAAVRKRRSLDGDQSVNMIYNVVMVVSGCGCSSCLGLPALPENVFWSKMGAPGEERCQEAKIDVGIDKCEKFSLL